MILDLPSFLSLACLIQMPQFLEQIERSDTNFANVPKDQIDNVCIC